MMNAQVRKRKQRAILSCIDCRRRKLKCDRESPCNRCVGGGYPEKCAYSPLEGVERPAKRPKSGGMQVVEDGEGASPGKLGSNDRIEHLERQIAELRETMRRIGSAENSTKDSATCGKECRAVDETDHSAASTGFFKGRGLRTFYYGISSPITIVAHFPDLRSFMRNIYTGSTLQKLRQDEKAHAERTRAKQVANSSLHISDLRSLLPSREVCDRVLKTYFDTFETTYRILHAPTFWASYTSYWDEGRQSNSDMDAIVIAVLACTLCTSTHETPRYNTTGSSSRSQAIIWLKACDAWLRRQSNKHRTLSSLQVRILKLLALSTTCMKSKEYYQKVQSHMAFMVSSGMHRDPRILANGCGVFEAEMRRRLWATSMELEMQASIDRGIPSLLSTLPYDCSAPSNINDADLDPDMKSLPSSYSSSSFTDTSYLRHSLRSLPLRAKLLSMATSLHASIPFQDILQAEQELHDALNTLPKWDLPRALMPTTLLAMQLHQFFPIIHTGQLLTPDLRTRTHTSHRHAALTSLEACDTLLTLHMRLLDAQNFALCALRFDYLRAALLIRLIAYNASIVGDTFLTRVARPIFEATSDSSLRLMEERSMRPGRGNHHYWLLSAATSLVNIQYYPEKRAVLELEATERVCSLLYRVLALQEEHVEGDPGDVVLEQRTVAAMETPVSLMDMRLPVGESQFVGGSVEVEDFEWEEGSAWMMDDHWFVEDFEAGTGMGF